MVLKTFLGLRKPPDRTPKAAKRRPANSVFLPIRGSEALERFMEIDGIDTVLDIGSGAGIHACHMRNAGKQVTCISLVEPADVLCDYAIYKAPKPFDGIWASHVLEHQLNVNIFLRKCFCDLKDGGVLAVTVPPLKHHVVGGHVTMWNAGTLLYNLILAGFDCHNARVGSYGYDLSVIVRKRGALLPNNLRYDEGDIEKLASFFPVPVAHGFDGRLGDINW